MTQRALSAITLLVRNYDEAISFYCDKLGFTLIEDTQLDHQKRWVKISPARQAHSSSCAIILALATHPSQINAIGQQCGNRVAFFLQTDDFDRDYAMMCNAGVTFLEEPRDEPYGRVVQFIDLYANPWDLIEHN